MDAIKELAAIAGLEIPRRILVLQSSPATSKHFRRNPSRSELVCRSLNSSHGVNARKYLLDRGFSEKIIKDFGFGYAPNNKFSLIENLKLHVSFFGAGRISNVH